jgi:glycine/D-amino acid oxidase-like deaminating enzyme
LLPSKADVVVIGSGVIGSSVAYHLSKRKMDVLLLEKNGLVSGTSGACDGLIYLQSKKPGPHLKLAMESRKRFDSLQQELGRSIEFRSHGGMIVLETQEEFEAMRLFVEEQKETGLEVTLLDGKQARELEPSLSEGVLGCTYSPLEGQVNPICLALAFLRGAKENGAKIFPHTGVTGFGVERNRIACVKTAVGKIETKKVVNAAGVHATHIGGMLGVEIPVKPRRGQIVVTEACSPLLKCGLLSAKYLAAKYHRALPDTEELGISIEQTQNGGFLLGSTREFAGFDRRTTGSAIRKIATQTSRILPVLRNLRVIRTFAGLRPSSPDGLPILGPVRNLEGFFMAAGHEGDGIALSPITGQIIAEWIAEGSPGTDLSPFHLERFFSPPAGKRLQQLSFSK